MRKAILSLTLGTSMLFTTVAPTAQAAVYHRHHYRSSYYARRAHHKTIKRVGVGAAGGALVGALAGGGKGAGIGALAGAGAGYLYDRHKKHEGRP
jgi:outer membrane lipoprotein SlyB